MKDKKICLNQAQTCMVEANLDIVHKVIRSKFTVNESLWNFSYEDLYQEGCIWLCKAAATYQADRAVKFETYASKVITNGLRTYCRLMCNKEKYQHIAIHTDEAKEPLERIPVYDNTENLLLEKETFFFLHSIKRQYKGAVKLGIEAIEWKLKGFSGKEIADMYGVKPNLVGAWISRAAGKLRSNENFIKYIRECVEK